ncbi:hypothetical protein F5Y16DRAFT_402323 [Xylariaceae sp. FL0255]|nr:hypothetical protein F5Y16DRAFT_402323 [Xylariaceae sp. FL0255]
MATLTIEHDVESDIYPNPREFDPLRFEDERRSEHEIATSGDPASTRHNFVFGAGRRLCQGIHIAERCLFLSIACLMWAFDISTSDPDKIDTEDLRGGLAMSPVPFDFSLALALLLALLLISLALPVGYNKFYGGKLCYVELHFFGTEGYSLLEVIEERMFGEFQIRLRQSTNGLPVNDMVQGGCLEPQLRHKGDNKFDERAQIGREVRTYPIQGANPVTACPQCASSGHSPICNHESLSSVESKAESGYDEMKIFTLIGTASMTVTLLKSSRPPEALLIGGVEGGMQRALARSNDVATGTMYRETVLRVLSTFLDEMFTFPRVRLGLRSPRKMGPGFGDVL